MTSDCRPPRRAIALPIPLETLATQRGHRISLQRVDIGDEVFVTGLFTLAPGQKKNLPIVRHGNVAMIPERANSDRPRFHRCLLSGRAFHRWFEWIARICAAH